MENNLTQEQISKEIEELTKLQDLKSRKDSILFLMRTQKFEFDESDIKYEVDIEKCSLYDLYTCTIVGSGVCSKCRGIIGRAPDYDNEK